MKNNIKKSQTYGSGKRAPSPMALKTSNPINAILRESTENIEAM